MTVIYGSSVADTTLTTACQMSTSTGGTETSKNTSFGAASGNFAEVWSQGSANVNPVTAIPATPTGHGWIYYPGAGTFATGNWSPVLTYAVAVNNAGNQTFRVFKRSGGTYTLLATFTFIATVTAKHTYTLTATSIATFTTASGDGIYFDLWYQDNTAAGGDNATIYESSSATAGVASDVQVTTATFTAGGGGNTIVGRARATVALALAAHGTMRSRLVEALAARGLSRSKFAEAIGQQSPVRSKFTESIGESGRARAGFVISKGIAGRVRAVYKEAIKQQAAQRSRFQIAVPLREAVRSTFKITTATGHAITTYIRAKYTASIKQTASPRSRFQMRFSQASQVRATFKTAIKSTIPVARSRFLVSLRLVSRSHTKFIIRLFQRFVAQATFKSAAKVKTVAQSRSFTRFGVAVRNTSRSLVSVRVAGRARARFVSSITQALRGRTHFLVNQILVILPIKSITQAVTQVLTLRESASSLLTMLGGVAVYLSLTWKALTSLQLSSVQTASLTLTHLQGQSMPAPNSTILSTVTVTDINGAAVSNASVVTATVYFPDGSSTVLSLGSGITNIGNGQYQAKYNTKNSGENREVWSITAADGVTIGSEQFKVGVSY